jgi:hypothetical protein
MICSPSHFFIALDPVRSDPLRIIFISKTLNLKDVHVQIKS